MNLLTQEEAQRLFRYDPETGKLYWRVGNGKGVLAGDEVGASSHGWLQTSYKGVRYMVHRLVWLVLRGDIPEGTQVDHRDCVRDNNRIENLRLASNSNNKCNSGVQANNKSGFKGVGFHKRHGRWAANIREMGKLRHLGYFDCPALAARAYDTSALRLHGEFAKTNAMLGLL